MRIHKRPNNRPPRPQTVLLTNKNASQAIERNKAHVHLLLTGGKKGGVGANYFNSRYNLNPVRYALVNKNNGTLRGFAIGTPTRNHKNRHGLYINVLAGPRYGQNLARAINSRARRNGYAFLNLSAVLQNRRAPPKQNALVGFYESVGYTPRLRRANDPTVPNGNTRGRLYPMRRQLAH